MDDLEAIRRMKNGDSSGLEILVARYQRKALQTAYLITHDEQLAEDVVQETFVRIYQHILQFDETRPFAPYLLRIVVNTALTASEKTARWVQFGAGTDVETVTDLLLVAASTEEAAENARLKQEVAAALKALPPRQRAVIVQRYYLGMSEKEMAETLLAAPGTVKWLLSNARERLRSLLKLERSAGYTLYSWCITRRHANWRVFRLHRLVHSSNPVCESDRMPIIHDLPPFFNQIHGKG